MNNNDRCWFRWLIFRYIKTIASGWWQEPYVYVWSAWSEDAIGFLNNHFRLQPDTFPRWHLWHGSPMTTLSPAILANSCPSSATGSLAMCMMVACTPTNLIPHSLVSPELDGILGIHECKAKCCVGSCATFSGKWNDEIATIWLMIKWYWMI